MVTSSWRIVIDPLGACPRVLVDFGDDITEQISRSIEAVVDSGRFDFAMSALPISRRNVRRTVSFSRVVEHEIADQSWHACAVELLAGPWAQKVVMEMSPLIGVRRFYAAALESSSHQPSSEIGLPESIHDYSFLVAPLSAMILPGGVVIIGGYFNPPDEYVLPPLPPGVTLPPNTNVEISGTPGNSGTSNPGLTTGGYVTGGPGLGEGEGGAVPVEPVETAKESLTFRCRGGVSVTVTRGAIYRNTNGFAVEIQRGPSTWESVSPGGTATIGSGIGYFFTPPSWNHGIIRGGIEFSPGKPSAEIRRASDGSSMGSVTADLGGVNLVLIYDPWATGNVTGVASPAYV